MTLKQFARRRFFAILAEYREAKKAHRHGCGQLRRAIGTDSRCESERAESLVAAGQSELSMYKIVRHYASKDKPKRTIDRGLTLQEAQAHCSSPESSSSTATSPTARRRTRRFGPWFDAYDESR